MLVIAKAEIGLKLAIAQTMNPSATNSRFQTDYLLDSLQTAVLGLNADLCIVNMNAAAQTLFRTSLRQVELQPVFTAIPLLGSQQSNVETAILKGTSMTLHHLRMAHNGGDPVTVDLDINHFQTADTQPGIALQFNVLDRHLRISRDALIDSQHETSQEVIRGLAHEIKNPLGGIRGAAQLLERELPSAELREYTDVIIGEADRLKKLVDRLMGPNTLPRFAVLNVHETLERVRKLIEADLPANVALHRDYDPSLPDLTADADQLTQAILNLAVNAVKAAEAAEDQGGVLLKTRVRRNFTIRGIRHRLVAQIDICDNGPGVEEDMLPMIFYPMVTTRAEGTGLGLPIAQTLVQQHKGLIEVTSQPGKTVFSVFLPILTLEEQHNE